MTPLEISEHKMRWMSAGHNHPVQVHSDMREQAKDWCKTQMHQSQWVHRKHTNVHEDTFFFEHSQDAESFCYQFKKAIDI